jgi:chromosome segregation ATPase
MSGPTKAQLQDKVRSLETSVLGYQEQADRLRANLDVCERKRAEATRFKDESVLRQSQLLDEKRELRSDLLAAENRRDDLEEEVTTLRGQALAIKHIAKGMMRS